MASWVRAGKRFIPRQRRSSVLAWARRESAGDMSRGDRLADANHANEKEQKRPSIKVKQTVSALRGGEHSFDLLTVCRLQVSRWRQVHFL